MTGRYCNDKRISQIVAGLLRDGWRYEMTAKHPRVIAPSGAVVVFSFTPTDGNAFRQFERDIRKVKSGVPIRPKVSA